MIVNSTAERLVAQIRGYGPCIVAFSGGVDSAVVACAAFQALGDMALAVTGDSPSVATGEVAAAKQLAAQIGIAHQVIATSELDDPNYRLNQPDRCYHCKTELYDHLAGLRGTGPWRTVVNGANLEDLSDYRPGLRAAQEFEVRSPLVECGLGKAHVRELAAFWGLPVWDKPASPCLASRIAYGEEVTAERLAMIDGAEQYLRGLGLRELRVRYHRGDIARIEVPLEQVQRLAETATRVGLVDALTRLGFRYVTLDLAGFRSGSLNALVELGPPELKRG